MNEEVYEENLTDSNDIKTSWRLPRDLLKQFKHLATDMDTNVTALVTQAMEEFIAKHRKKMK